MHPYVGFHMEIKTVIGLSVSFREGLAMSELHQTQGNVIMKGGQAVDCSGRVIRLSRSQASHLFFLWVEAEILKRRCRVKLQQCVFSPTKTTPLLRPYRLTITMKNYFREMGFGLHQRN